MSKEATRCPDCGSLHSSVKNSRPHDHGQIPTIRRTRQCVECGARHHTLEIPEPDVSAWVVQD